MKLRLFFLCMVVILASAAWGYAAANAGSPVSGVGTENTSDHSAAVADNSSESNPSYHPLTLGGRVLKPEQARVMRLGDKAYLPLTFFSTCLHAGTTWNSAKGIADIRLGKLVIQVTDGSPRAVWNGKSMPLSYSPIVMNDGMWIPVELLQTLGMQVTDSQDGVVVEWKHNYLLFVKSSTYQGRPAVTFQTTRPTEQKDFLLSNPDRLVLDLKGVELFPYFEEEWKASYAVQGVRVNQFSSDVFRMVLDLARPIGYRIVVPDDGSQQVIVVFDSLIQKVTFDPRDGDPRVAIDGLAPLQFKTTVAANPDRLIIDLPNARIEPNQGVIQGDDHWVKSIRFSQYDTHQVRIVLDLKSTRACYIVSSRQHPNHLEIRTQQTIEKIQWVPDDLGGYLQVQSSGRIDGEFAHLKAPERLTLNLRYAKIAPKCARNLTVGVKPLRNVKVTQASSSEVRLEMALDFYLGYEATFSEDRRTMMIRMKESPLRGRIVVLDPGHGGSDPGAMGSQGVREKEVNLEVAFRLKALLEEAGARVVMTRHKDEYVGLYERAAIANQANAAIFISIHTNFHPNPKVTGVEVFHYPGRSGSQRLAALCLEEMTKASGLEPIAVKANKEFVVTRETQMTSVLVELGFLSNYQEESKIATTEFRENMARGIFQAIARYWNKEIDLGTRHAVFNTDMDILNPLAK